ncbi:conserved hypothetical protein [Ricinus communis]|uniref:RNase H type-1 domain-containing protein n=1 Tax=Ricinus communis TaxID=3988 RepID=B9RJI0_RICCO|nr:conserved hypothetical protein [Ricinus communis]
MAFKPPVDLNKLNVDASYNQESGITRDANGSSVVAAAHASYRSSSLFLNELYAIRDELILARDSDVPGLLLECDNIEAIELLLI